jgi:hypothetical protein
LINPNLETAEIIAVEENAYVLGYVFLTTDARSHECFRSSAPVVLRRSEVRGTILATSRLSRLSAEKKGFAFFSVSTYGSRLR